MVSRLSLDYEGIHINPGDIIIASVNATSAREGVCSIENLTTGLLATQTVNARSSAATLKGWSAELAVEDFGTVGDKVAFSGFSDMRFDRSIAETGGLCYGVYDAVLYGLATAEAVNATELVISCT